MRITSPLLSKIISEIADFAEGGKIEKVIQPSRAEIVLTIKSGRGRRDLYIGSAGGAARVNLTRADYDKPSEPPMFCMLLRKHLVGARIEAVTQPNGDRIAAFDLLAPGMFGEGEKRRLVCELFGRAVNVILTDGEGVITDCLRRVGSVEEERAILPGMKYREPEKPDRADRDEPEVPEKYESFNDWVDDFFREKAAAERKARLTGDLYREMRRLRDRTERRLEAQRNELYSAGNREYTRECGDIITTNLHAMKKGQSVLIADDYYRGGKREIKLDPLKTPQANAAKYYKDYVKQRNAEEHLTTLIASGEEELDYLNSVLEEIQRAEKERDIIEIRHELQESGILRRARSKKPERFKADEPMRFMSTDGLLIRVGRNNVQNDLLTLKNSAKTDLWLHTQKIHGSHVVVSANGGEVPESTIVEAASLAAYYSGARDATKAPVDYALVKYVKKPAGAKPGMVIYTNYKTIIAEPGVRDGLKNLK